jgi:hypothetical protein
MPRFSLRTLMVVIALLAIPLAYAGPYISRSRRGCYKPAIIGLSGVKSYDWAPAGFVDGYVWNRSSLEVLLSPV